MQVSHETIYQALYVQTRGRLRADLHRQLSLKRRQRKPRTADRRGEQPLQGGVHDQPTARRGRRPGGARALGGRPDHGPGGDSAIGTLVERSTRFTILLHLPGRHDADDGRRGDDPRDEHLPEHLRRSITWDRGTELADYATIQLALGHARSTSATRTRPGSAAPTRTPTGSCGSGSRKAPTSPCTPPRTSAGSPRPSTAAPAYPGPADPSQPAEPAAAQQPKPRVAPTS